MRRRGMGHELSAVVAAVQMRIGFALPWRLVLRRRMHTSLAKRSKWLRKGGQRLQLLLRSTGCCFPTDYLVNLGLDSPNLVLDLLHFLL